MVKFYAVRLVVKAQLQAAFNLLVSPSFLTSKENFGVGLDFIHQGTGKEVGSLLTSVAFSTESPGANGPGYSQMHSEYKISAL